MFVLVVDTSVTNVSILAVVHDLHTTVSSVQSAIALEALVSAAFILIGSKVADLFGRKRAYVLGLLGYAIGALAMAIAQSLTAREGGQTAGPWRCPRYRERTSSHGRRRALLPAGLVSPALSSCLKCDMLWHATNWTSEAGVGVE